MLPFRGDMYFAGKTSVTLFVNITKIPPALTIWVNMVALGSVTLSSSSLHSLLPPPQMRGKVFYLVSSLFLVCCLLKNVYLTDALIVVLLFVFVWFSRGA